MKEKSYGFIGGGRVVRILLKALSNKGAIPANVIVSDSNEEVMKKLQNEFPGIKITNDITIPAACGYLFISLHPPVIQQTLDQIKGFIKPEGIIISLAPKFTIEKISTLLNGFSKIVRMIPNAPSYINKGYNPVSYSSGISEAEKNELRSLFSILGEHPEVEEPKLEAYAIITAMGPTYFWFQLQQLQELGVSFGLTEKELQDGITAMINGAVETLYNSGLKSSGVIDLIPVKPLAEFEKGISENYTSTLKALFNKLKS